MKRAWLAAWICVAGLCGCDADLRVSWVLDEGSDGMDPIPPCQDPDGGRVAIEAEAVAGGEIVRADAPCTPYGEVTLGVDEGAYDVHLEVIAFGETVGVSEVVRVDVDSDGAEVRIVLNIFAEVAHREASSEDRAMDKGFLIAQLRDRLDEAAREIARASDVASAEARARPIENSNLARGLTGRAAQARAAADALSTFRPAPFAATATISLGAIVEIEDEDSGEGRTFFLAPAGAGVTLTGPGGDGYLSVVTPASPIGRAVLGRRRGDVIDVTVEGDVHSWSITDVA